MSSAKCQPFGLALNMLEMQEQKVFHDINGLSFVQHWGNSSVSAMELPQFCTKPLIYSHMHPVREPNFKAKPQSANLTFGNQAVF